MNDRPMNPMQLAFHHLGDLANPNSGELITLDGHLDTERLGEAIELALARHPLLNSVPVKRFGRYFWREASSSLPIDIRFHETPETQDDNVLPMLLRNLWDERLPEDGRQVRFFYTKGPHRSYLQICAPHTVTDAWSGTRLAADIASAYTALSEGRSWSAGVVRPLEQDVSEAFLTGISVRQRLALAAETARRLVRDVVTPGSGLELPKTQVPGETCLAITHVPAHLLEDTLRVARKHGATAHSLFLLALTRARNELLGERAETKPLRINDFATLRPYANRDLRDAFDVLVVPNQITVEPEWDDLSTLNTLSQHIREQKLGAILPELYRLSLYGFLARFMPTNLTAGLVFRLINKTDLAVTNPGPVPWQKELERFGNVAIDDFVNFPHLLPPAKVVLILTTFRGVLRIVQLYDPKTTPGGIEASLVQPFIRHLKRLVALLEQTPPSAEIPLLKTPGGIRPRSVSPITTRQKTRPSAA